MCITYKNNSKLVINNGDSSELINYADMLYLEALKNKLTTLRLFMTYGERIIKGSISEIVIPALDKRGGHGY